MAKTAIEGIHHVTAIASDAQARVVAIAEEGAA